MPVISHHSAGYQLSNLLMISNHTCWLCEGKPTSYQLIGYHTCRLSYMAVITHGGIVHAHIVRANIIQADIVCAYIVPGHFIPGHIYLDMTYTKHRGSRVADVVKALVHHVGIATVWVRVQGAAKRKKGIGKTPAQNVPQ